VKKANIAGAIMGMLFSASAFILTLGFKQFKNVPVGPEFFPRYLAVGLFICSAVLLIQALLSGSEQDKPAPTLSLRNPGMRRLLMGLGIIILYAWSWETLGFPLATPVAMFALMFLLGLRRYLLMLLFSCGAMGVIFCTFKFLLGIDMPLGLGERLFY
jgi:putative tricarboxylic transport membrane protein